MSRHSRKSGRTPFAAPVGSNAGVAAANPAGANRAPDFAFRLKFQISDLKFIFPILLAVLTIGCGSGNSYISPPPSGAPSDLSYTSPLAAVVGAAITPLSPSVNGTVTSYSVKPALPSGLSLNPTTGVISGTPTAGAVQAAYTITASNSSGSTTFSLSLSVISATELAIALSTSSLNFGNQLVSTQSPAQTVAVINIGTDAITVDGTMFTGGAPSSFAASSNCRNLAPGDSCQISVTFTPAASGSLVATLDIQTNDAARFVGLSGSGVPVDISLSPPIIPAGGNATLSWSAPGAASCAASDSWTGTLAASGSQTVTQSAPGYYTYTLTCAGISGSYSTVLTTYGTTPQITEPANELGYQADFYIAPPNQLVGLQTTLTVPPAPPVPTTNGAAIFLWPGVGPATGSVNFNPINDGVLQPVLSWGPSCAPTPQPAAFSSWWISAQYVNTFGSDPGYTGCFSGDSLLVNPGDALLINMVLDSSTGIWLQTITDANTNQSASFSINMQAQGQNWAYFAMEFWYGTTMSTPVTFSNTTLTFQSADSQNWCSSSQGANSNFTFTLPVLQNASTQCFINSVVIMQPE
jgi:hypothetical protein